MLSIPCILMSNYSNRAKERMKYIVHVYKRKVVTTVLGYTKSYACLTEETTRHEKLLNLANKREKTFISMQKAQLEK